MTSRGLLLFALALTTAACAAHDENRSQGPAGPASATIITTTTAVEADPAGADSTSTAPMPPATSAPSTTTTFATTTAAPVMGDPVVASEVVGEFDRPIDLAVRPGDEALWIVQQGGQVVRFDRGTSSVALDLAGRLSSGGEQGLLGLVFHPVDDLAYVNFTDRSGATNIVEYAVEPDGRLDPASERLVLQVAQPFGNHNAGDLEFGPDGMLYVPLGDGGSGGDPERNGSNPATLLGSILRIDPTAGGDVPYLIPPDNPFAGGAVFAGVTGAPEVWAWGLRNPWKIAFDPVTDELWIPDVGQNEFEEINVVGRGDDEFAGRGLDFGWSAFEGTERFNRDVPDTGRTTAPVLTYSHTDGCSISGGIPYRGTAIPGLEPAFVYSDYCTGTIWALDLARGRNLTLLEGFDNVASVRAGPDDELYVIERSGNVHRLVAG